MSADDDTDPGTELPDKLFFRIGEAATLIGVETHVLRYWETEFRVRPQRSSTGQRMYRRKDIARFIRIKRLLHEEGFTIAGARKALSESTSAAPVGDTGSSSAPIEAGQAREALARVDELRRRVEALQAKVAQAGVASGAPRS